MGEDKGVGVARNGGGMGDLKSRVLVEEAEVCGYHRVGGWKKEG